VVFFFFILLSPLIRLERENNKIDPLFNMNLHVIKTSHLLSFTDMSRHRISEEIPLLVGSRWSRNPFNGRMQVIFYHDEILLEVKRGNNSFKIGMILLPKQNFNIPIIIKQSCKVWKLMTVKAMLKVNHVKNVNN
jgi:hypothetical protein